MTNVEMFVTIPKPVWTQKRVALLKRLWSDGYSGSEIARRLGDVTRNAVIGKVHRLGLAPAKEKPRRGRVKAMARAKAKPLPRVTPRSRADRIIEKPMISVQPLPDMTAGPVPSNLFKFRDWENPGCRWVYDGPNGELMFGCTSDRVPGLSYCAAHARSVYSTALVGRDLAATEVKAREVAA